MPPKSKFSDVFELVLSNLILICMVLVSVYRGLFCDCNSVRVKTWWPNFIGFVSLVCNKLWEVVRGQHAFCTPCNACVSRLD